MRRLIAAFMTALFVGIQFLLPATPAAGEAASCCPGLKKMACCSVQNHCAAGSVCAAHDSRAKAASMEICLRAAGCGHANPGVVAPTLDPAFFAANAIALAAPRAERHSEATPASPASISDEPLSPPPRG
jgi:hypothetical protein